MPTKTALIVDDEPNVRYFLAAGLARLGFECSEASGGQVALDRLATEKFDVMLLDVRMPGVDGLEVLRQARAASVRTPVVVLSALGDPEVAASALGDEGASTFLAKPFGLAQLREAVLDVCSTGTSA